MFDARDFGGELLAEKSVEERRGDRDARIRNEHCPFQACVTYQVDSITGTWGNTTESYRSTDPVYSTVAGETYDFMAKITCAGGGRALRLQAQAPRHEADRSQGAFHDRSDDAASPLCLF